MSENNAVEPVETPSVEELQAQLAQANEATAKAEAKIVELKKSSKQEAKTEEPAPAESTPVTPLDDASLDKMLAKREFLKANPELSEHADTFGKLLDSGLSNEGAKAAIYAEVPELKNQEKTNSMSMTGDLISPEKSTYTQDELIKIAGSDQLAYNQLMDRVDKGEASII